ncbi:unnamed protein product [Clonostachys rhizophaga]|uniref:Uncharacterized protein n=1 Tax=Clonostachys rhizophaga TaxID=160324 RepID=A0A9N9VFC2_9HYPO|nr:unnamed protein product [Clonostachys rhizophaga]
MILPQWRLSKKQLNTISDSDRLLTQLHKTHIELSNSHSVISYGKAFGVSCNKAVVQIEEYRKSLGYTPLPTRDLRGFEEDLDMMHSQAESIKSRITALSSRLSGMINVIQAYSFHLQSFNLIAKRDSKVNVAIAKLQARESRTVKGISILTFSLLPATFLAIQKFVSVCWISTRFYIVRLHLFLYLRPLARKLEVARWPDPAIMDTLNILPSAWVH